MKTTVDGFLIPESGNQEELIKAAEHKSKIAGYLQEMCNKYGDFKVAISRKQKDGTVSWTKHHSVMELWEKGEKGRWFLANANHRQLLPIEIVLDLDENPTLEQMNNICEELEKSGWRYQAYFTGSRGYHIHIQNNKLFSLNKRLKEQYRLNIILEYRADCHKKNDVMIAIENTSHWKTGKVKTLLRQYPKW